jgi:hypothetical protein
MDSLTCAVTEFYSAYWEREKKRQIEEERRQNAHAMFVDKDFIDRLYLFMADLIELDPGRGLDKLPHYGLYFNEEETEKLSKYTRLSDKTATPEDILLSFEEVYSSIRIKINGVWKRTHENYIKWIRHEKVCRPGTLRGIQAEEILKIHLEEEEREKKAEERKNHTADLRKKAAKRRKTDCKKAERESTAGNSEVSKSDESEERP